MNFPIQIDREFLTELNDRLLDEIETRIPKREPKEWLSPKEAMVFLGNISRSKLQELRNTNKICYSKPSKKLILYRRSSLEDFLEENVQ